MDQIKIGMFIADLRKEQGMTQKQLAETIGVSDKTISKWECGNGLPEMSSIPVLCSALGINMNELLSGEKLAEETYSKKAEENMMTLMKETEEHKKKNKASLITLVLCLSGVVLVMILALSFGIGYSAFWAFFDMSSLVMVFVPTMLILAAAGLIKPFFQAFTMLGKDNSQYTEQQKKKAKRALCLGADSFLTVGGFESLATIILLLGSHQKGMSTELLLANIAIALVTILYGVAAYLLLLPVRRRLEVEIGE